MIKVGILGSGTMGRYHANCYAKIEDVKISGILDINKEMGEKFGVDFNCKYFSDLDELLKVVDVIDICLPTIFHKDAVIKGANAKKHILCEKPIAREKVDAISMIDICNKNKIKFMVAHVLRFFPEYVAAKQIIDRGEIGKPAIARTSRGSSFPRGAGDWYKNIEESGGVILDMIIHDFDFLRWCFGEVERVYAKSLTYKNIPYTDYALVSLRFKNKVIAHVEGSWAYPKDTPFVQKLEVAGSKGLLDVELGKCNPSTIYLKKKEGSEDKVVVPEIPLYEDPYGLEIKHFLECVKKDKEPDITPLDALKALEISLAALSSAKNNEVVYLEVEK